MSMIGSPKVKSHSLGGNSQREGLREYEVVYILKSDATDGPFIVGNANGLPSRGETYRVPLTIDASVTPAVLTYHATELDVGATLVGILPVAVDRTKAGKVIWHVTCTYSSKGLRGNPSNEETSPLLRLAKRDWGSANYIHYPHQDLSIPPKDFVNTAGHPYDAVPIEEAVVTLTLTKAQARFDPNGILDGKFHTDGTKNLFDIAAAKAFQNAVHGGTDLFYGQPAGEALCKSIRGNEAFEDGIEYINVTYEFHFRDPDDQGDGTAEDTGDPSTTAWQLQLMDKGPYYIDGGLPNGTKKAHDLDGTETTDDIKLNGTDGDKLADGADAAYNLFNTRKTKDLNALGV